MYKSKKRKQQKEQNCPIRKSSEHSLEKESYKYLGILEADTIKQTQMKENSKK